MAYDPRADDKQYVLTGMLDNIENGAIGTWDWIQKQAEDDPDRWDDDVLRLLGGGLKNTAWAISKIPLINKLAEGEDWLADQARKMNETLTPWLDPRVAGWGTRIGTGILADKGIRKATGAVTKGVRAYKAVSKADEIMAAAKNKELGLQMMAQVDNGVPLVTRAMAEPVSKELVEQLRVKFGKTKAEAGAFLAANKTAEKEVRTLIDWLNVKSLELEPQKFEDFLEAAEVALGYPVKNMVGEEDFRTIITARNINLKHSKPTTSKDFLRQAGGRITYKSAKGKEIIETVEQMKTAFYNRMTAVRGKPHWSLGHIRAVKNLIDSGDLGANRLSNLEPETLRSILRFADDAKYQDFPLEEIVATFGNSARKNFRDLPDQLLMATDVPSTIGEEFLKFTDPIFKDYWKKVLPEPHRGWFMDSVESTMQAKLKLPYWNDKIRRVARESGSFEVEKIKRKLRRQIMDEYLDILPAPTGEAFEALRNLGLDQIILEQAPEIIWENVELIKKTGKYKWIEPKVGDPGYDKWIQILKTRFRHLERGDDFRLGPSTQGLE